MYKMYIPKLLVVDWPSFSMAISDDPPSWIENCPACKQLGQCWKDDSACRVLRPRAENWASSNDHWPSLIVIYGGHERQVGLSLWLINITTTKGWFKSSLTGHSPWVDFSRVASASRPVCRSAVRSTAQCYILTIATKACGTWNRER